MRRLRKRGGTRGGSRTSGRRVQGIFSGRVATKTTYEDQHHFGAPELITSSSLPSWGQGPLSAPTSAADIKADLGTWKHSGEPFPETWSFGAECYGPSCLAQGGGEVSGAGPSAHGNPIHLWLGYPVPQNWSTTGQGSLRRKVSLRPGNPFQSLRPALRTQPLTSQQLQCIQELSSRRLQRMPVQYILGEWDFQGLSLKMMPPVFIPRPETEELVEWVLEEVAQRSHAVGSPGSPLILEVGCGSGAISLSLLSQLPQSRVIAVDKGEAAISLTHENAQRLRLQDRIWIIHLDMTSGVSSWKWTRGTWSLSAAGFRAGLSCTLILWLCAGTSVGGPGSCISGGLGHSMAALWMPCQCPQPDQREVDGTFQNPGSRATQGGASADCRANTTSAFAENLTAPSWEGSRPSRAAVVALKPATPLPDSTSNLPGPVP
uniref:MTRF1L release factor glutamine methyltransferase isoform X2 n=1 Tax=Callithrix jacchus TaxID=9483 RepID=UPI00159EB6FF|nr:MTRF1L release factor glutamine methyltransferase isoform X2 [Callithrix jacchus]